MFFRKIKQPVVLGYLVAGFLVGPEVSFFPTVQEREAIKVWAEIGVIVLLFALGLEFSFRKLLSVGKGAVVTALTEVLFMLGIGYLVGQAFGWSQMDSLFLGGILSISSTTIIIKAFDEMGLRQKRFANLVFGVLIIEDLVAVLLLVLLSTISLTNSFSGIALVESAAKLVFFLALWFLGGIFLVPWFLRKVSKALNDESILIVAMGLCLLMVIIATKTGFSPALGAFVMGSILAETIYGSRIEHILRPVRDLFAAVFFVSVGMLIELEPLQTYWFEVLVISFLTVAGKILSVTSGALMGGQGLSTSIKSGLSLAQIGEFSFIIATLGLSLGVVSPFLYPLAVAVSAITTLLTPYLIRSSEGVNSILQNRLPEGLLARLNSPGGGNVVGANSQEQKAAENAEVFRLFFNSIAIIAVSLLVKTWLSPIVHSALDSALTANLVLLFLTLLLSLPSFWAVLAGSAILRTDKYRFDDIRRLTTQALLILAGRILFGLFLLGFVVTQFTSLLISLVVVAPLGLFFLILGFRNFSRIYQWLESRFVANLNQKTQHEANAQSSQPILPPLAPWDAHLNRIQVHPESKLVGFKLSEVGVREKFGISIAVIERGSRRIFAPRRDDLLMAFDSLLVIGTDQQLTEFSKAAGPEAEAAIENLPLMGDFSFGLHSLRLEKNSPWIGKSILHSGLREATHGLIVGIERSSERILNPDSAILLCEEDIIWIVGETKKVKEIFPHSN